MQCSECNAPCYSISCLNEHHVQKNGNKSLCKKKMLFCPSCKVKLNNYQINGIDLDKHTCGERFCKQCQAMYHNDEEEDFHKYFMRSIPASKSSTSKRRFIFYDFESMIMILDDHIPNLVVVHKWINVTRVKSNSKCKVCGSGCKKCNRVNICTDPVTIQFGGGLPPMYGDEEEEVLGDDDLTVNVLNFPSTFFILN